MILCKMYEDSKKMTKIEVLAISSINIDLNFLFWCNSLIINKKVNEMRRNNAKSALNRKIVENKTPLR